MNARSNAKESAIRVAAALTTGHSGNAT